MSDLIRRQDAIDVLEILADKMSDEGQTVMTQAVAVLKDLRSAGPEWALESAIDYLHSVGWLQEHDRILTEFAEPERKTGEWIDGMLYYDFDECEWEKVKCSVCEKFVTKQIFYYDNKYHYCPNCGAKMTRDENE